MSPVLLLPFSPKPSANVQCLLPGSTLAYIPLGQPGDIRCLLPSVRLHLENLTTPDLGDHLPEQPLPHFPGQKEES
jgi:hypothetical protein